MDLINTIPYSQVNNSRLREYLRYKHMSINYLITDIFITENLERPVLSNIGRKRAVNLTVSGVVTNEIKVPESYIMMDSKDYDPYLRRSTRYDNVKDYYDYDDMINLYNENMNFTYKDIRINPYGSMYTGNERDFFIDRTHAFYHDFIKQILLKDNILDSDMDKDVTVSYDELKALAINKEVNLSSFIIMSRWPH